MRSCVLLCLAWRAAGVNVPLAADTGSDVPAVSAVHKGVFGRLGDMINKTANEVQFGQLKAVTAAQRARAKAKRRADSAAGRLEVLKASLPKIRQSAADLCSGKEASVCETRMKMFQSIASKVESGDVQAVEMLRLSTQLLQDFLHMDSTLRGAISSLTLYELADRPPKGMRVIADISPADGTVDRYEWSEYMKAAYLFTLTDETAAALEMKHGKSGKRMKQFISWDLRDAALPKPTLEMHTPSKAAPAMNFVPPLYGA